MDFPTNFEFKILAVRPEFIAKIKSQSGVVFQITTHRLPHFDEWLSLWLLWKFADRKFFQENGTDLQIGIGQGVFDEHELKKEGQKTCAAQLVAEKIGVLNHPYLQRIIQGATSADTSGAYKFLNLSDIALTFGQVIMSDPKTEENALKRLMLFIFDSLEAAYLKSAGVAGAKKIFLEKKYREFSWKVEDWSSDFKIIFLENDTPFIMDALNLLTKSKKINWAVLIVRRSSGNLAVIANKNEKDFLLETGDFFAALAKKEPEIWHTFASHVILNGNERYLKPASKIKPEEMVDLIKQKMDVVKIDTHS